MGVEAYALVLEEPDGKYREMTEYLSSEGGYWLKEDRWYTGAECFTEAGIRIAEKEKNWILADFSGYRADRLKLEMKYYYLWSMKEKWLTAKSLCHNYVRAVREIGKYLGELGMESLEGQEELQEPVWLEGIERQSYLHLYHTAARFITDFYDDREETEKDVWILARIPGVKQSAADKRLNHSLDFREIPLYYRDMVKQYMARLIVRRSYSLCYEKLVYIRYFFRVFYKNGYENGFFEALKRQDMEKYLGWVAADYADKNATVRSKTVLYIRHFIDYIQLAEYEQAPVKDVTRLLFDDDIPRRERAEDTRNKVKYIPEPVKEQLDASLQELEPEEMRPVYVLLRESGWRGTDVLNLRYDNCLEYLWSEKNKEYIPYLCGEITKTGIPVLKIPVRSEVAEMVKELAGKVKEQSTEENNPEHYLFNTFEGKNKGLPYSKPAFSKAVQELINKKGILDGDGQLYHFRAHSLRHTRAMEYTEQGMPIGIIQQILGHCSLQMTVHYSKVSENMLYEKWKETEKLELLHLDSRPPQKVPVKEEGLHYEFIRKNLDAVKVPFGVCFKPAKIPCRQQMNHCVECANFCTCRDNIPEYEAEIDRVRKQIELSNNLDRIDWVEKNRNYLETLEKMLERIRAEGLVHKNGHIREECDG
ncbi:MAG: tyrosine-type recombinase/integrase [Lachnospiraceae bacterium]|nr:tyrosine-type recombinase/integrase [Lachnospiraceae bacterium]